MDQAREIARRLVMAAAVASCVVSAAAGRAAGAPEPEPSAFASGSAFERRPISVRERKLFDLGVVDHNDDGRFDVFTVNHKFPASFKVGLGGGGFGNRYARLGLSPSPAFPGLEAIHDPPKPRSAGVHMWINRRGRLHLVARGLGSSPQVPAERVNGVLRFLGVARTTARRRVAVDKRFNSKKGPTRTIVRFRLRAGSRLVLDPPFIDLPIRVELGPEIAPSRIYVGSRAVSPAANELVLHLRDRHGIAWADLDGDGDTDAYVVRGGLSGNSAKFRGVLRDEVLLRHGPRFRHRQGLLGKKGRCRGRDAFAIDFSGDGRLDLFSSCDGSRPRLYRQRADGRFGLEPAALRGAANATDFAWIDVRGDRRPELVAAGGRRIHVYRRLAKARWRRVQSIRAPGGHRSVVSILPAAIDRGARPDLVVLSKRGNAVAINRRGRLRLRSPRSVGLPEASFAGAWVDYDNDGAEDLHLVPQGIYERARGRLAYRRTGLLSSAAGLGFAIVNWADLDSDGDRDPLLAYKRGGERVDVVRFRNRRGRGRWLQVEVRGPAGYREAVGARVTVETASGRQHRWVGGAEGSRFSQGHYRVYFGVGRARRIKKLVVHWPGGGSSVRRGVRANRLIRVSR